MGQLLNINQENLWAPKLSLWAPTFYRLGALRAPMSFSNIIFLVCISYISIANVLIQKTVIYCYINVRYSS